MPFRRVQTMIFNDQELQCSNVILSEAKDLRWRHTERLGWRSFASLRMTWPVLIGKVHCLLACIFLLTACNGGVDATNITPLKTPIPSMAAGEPILPHSQVFLHDAPLPSQADAQYDSSAWTLAGFDNAATHAVTLQGCCETPPIPAWFQSLGTPLLDAPVISHGLVYLLASDGFLHVLRASDGAEQWRVPVGGDMSADGVAIGGGILYLAQDGHYLAALDAQHGKLLWRFDAGDVVRGSPVVIGPDVLVASGGNSLYCLDARTGQEYWAFHSEDTLAQFWPTRGVPAVANNLVYVALGASNEFNALQLKTGRKVWEVNLHERITGGPVLDMALGLVYLVTWSGKVVALDMHTGALRWRYALATGSESSPALDQEAGALSVGDYGGSLYALNARTGGLRWRVDMGSAINTTPLVLRTAQQSWLIVAAQGGTLSLFDAANARREASWQLGELRASPVVAQGMLFQASLSDLGLFAIRL
jgi:outer membrane protein assembly factor BamB